jgi:hypothetical protein
MASLMQTSGSARRLAVTRHMPLLFAEVHISGLDPDPPATARNLGSPGMCERNLLLRLLLLQRKSLFFCHLRSQCFVADKIGLLVGYRLFKYLVQSGLAWRGSAPESMEQPIHREQ